MNIKKLRVNTNAFESTNVISACEVPQLPTGAPTTLSPNTSPPTLNPTDSPATGTPSGQPTPLPVTYSPTGTPTQKPTAGVPPPTVKPTPAPLNRPGSDCPPPAECSTPERSCGWGIWNAWTCQCDCAPGFCLSHNQEVSNGFPATRTVKNGPSTSLVSLPHELVYKPKWHLNQIVDLVSLSSTVLRWVYHYHRP